MSDPTYGRIDPDIQARVDEMNPPGIGERVAWENTLQAKRDATRQVTYSSLDAELSLRLHRLSRRTWWQRIIDWIFRRRWTKS